MVDRDVEIPGLNPKGKLLTLTTNEALARQVADRQANTLDSLLMGSGLGSAEIVRLSPNCGGGIRPVAHASGGGLAPPLDRDTRDHHRAQDAGVRRAGRARDH